jgi:hypothetical protein
MKIAIECKECVRDFAGANVSTTAERQSVFLGKRTLKAIVTRSSSLSFGYLLEIYSRLPLLLIGLRRVRGKQFGASVVSIAVGVLASLLVVMFACSHSIAASVALQCDLNNNVSRQTTPQGVNNYLYDALDRLTSESAPPPHKISPTMRPATARRTARAATPACPTATGCKRSAEPTLSMMPQVI